jgi:hypothetical protein
MYFPETIAAAGALLTAADFATVAPTVVADNQLGPNSAQAKRFAE